MMFSPTVFIDDPFEEAPDDGYACPVCGTGLSVSDFRTPERDYYCPACSTRQTPTIVA